MKLHFCMQYIENLYKMVSIKCKLFTTTRYELIYNIEWRIGRKHSSIFVAKITKEEGVIVRAPKGVNLTNSGWDVKLGLKVAIDPLVLGTICWDGQFYLRRSKIRGSLGVPAEFPPEKWSTPKNWNIAISWLRIPFRS